MATNTNVARKAVRAKSDCCSTGVSAPMPKVKKKNVNELLTSLEGIQPEKIVTERGKCQLLHGANDGEFPIEGMTIAQVRKQFENEFNIPADAQALIDGQEVSEDTTIKASVTVEFIKILGSKGVRTSE